MPKIRIAQLGWKFDGPAATLDEVTVGLRCMWVEIDGVRTDSITGVEIEIPEDGIGIPTATIPILGAIEIVYVDKAGDELGSAWAEPEILEGVIDNKAEIVRGDLGGERVGWHRTRRDVAVAAVADVLTHIGDPTRDIEIKDGTGQRIYAEALPYEATVDQIAAQVVERLTYAGLIPEPEVVEPF